jgi:hypothetical protein
MAEQVSKSPDAIDNAPYGRGYVHRAARSR